MKDRELLELAAKAAGVAVHHWSYADCPDCPDAVPVLTDGINTEIVVWNPLADDGDALQLAVKLGIEYGFGYNHDESIQRVIVDDKTHVLVENDNPYAATRRAIVRAAAEIGMAMK